MTPTRRASPNRGAPLVTGASSGTGRAVAACSESLRRELRLADIHATLIGRSTQPTDAPLPADDWNPAGVGGMMAGAIAGARPPEAVAAVVLEAAKGRRPRLRNPVGRDAVLLGLARRFPRRRCSIARRWRSGVGA